MRQGFSKKIQVFRQPNVNRLWSGDKYGEPMDNWDRSRGKYIECILRFSSRERVLYVVNLVLYFRCELGEVIPYRAKVDTYQQEVLFFFFKGASFFLLKNCKSSERETYYYLTCCLISIGSVLPQMFSEQREPL